MKKAFFTILSMGLVSLAFAQVRMPQPSPTQYIKQDFGLSTIELTYSRPSLKGREIIGEVEPWNVLWRTGANAATKIRFNDPVEIFGHKVDTGNYAIYTIPQKNDAIIYDQLSHASLRDGVRLSFASAFSFLHNDLDDLEKKLSAVKNTSQNIFVVTESVFSMDGDFAPLKEIIDLCEKYNAALIVDEAHATGVVGKKGAGLVQQLNLEKKCFARIHTFGKACGAHGAIVLGSEKLKKYLVNFARTFIYSTSLPPAAVEAIRISYKTFPAMQKERDHINELINIFKKAELKYKILQNNTPIQVVIIPGNEEVKKMAKTLQENNFDIRDILYPTVPKGQERLRIVLHSFNSEGEVEQMVKILAINS